VTLTPSPLLVP